MGYLAYQQTLFMHHLLRDSANKMMNEDHCSFSANINGYQQLRTN